MVTSKAGLIIRELWLLEPLREEANGRSSHTKLIGIQLVHDVLTTPARKLTDRQGKGL